MLDIFRKHQDDIRHAHSQLRGKRLIRGNVNARACITIRRGKIKLRQRDLERKSEKVIDALPSDIQTHLETTAQQIYGSSRLTEKERENLDERGKAIQTHRVMKQVSSIVKVHQELLSKNKKKKKRVKKTKSNDVVYRDLDPSVADNLREQRIRESKEELQRQKPIVSSLVTQTVIKHKVREPSISPFWILEVSYGTKNISNIPPKVTLQNQDFYLIQFTKFMIWAGIDEDIMCKQLVVFKRLLSNGACKFRVQSPKDKMRKAGIKKLANHRDSYLLSIPGTDLRPIAACQRLSNLDTRFANRFPGLVQEIMIGRESTECNRSLLLFFDKTKKHKDLNS